MKPESTSSVLGPTDHVIPVYQRWFGTWQIAIGRRPLDPTQLAALYDKHAATWDAKLRRLGVVNAYATMLQQALPRRAFDQDRPRVLDAGIGTGAMSLALGQIVRGPLRLSGIDLSNRMLVEAGQRLADTGFHLDLRQGDITALPYEDDSFDVVMTAHTVEHLGRPAKALAEFRRVLKPGGCLIACVTTRSALATYIQIRWQTHRIAATDMQPLLLSVGFENPHALRFDKGTSLRRISVPYIAHKPHR